MRIQFQSGGRSIDPGDATYSASKESCFGESHVYPDWWATDCFAASPGYASDGGGQLRGFIPFKPHCFFTHWHLFVVSLKKLVLAWLELSGAMVRQCPQEKKAKTATAAGEAALKTYQGVLNSMKVWDDLDRIRPCFWKPSPYSTQLSICWPVSIRENWNPLVQENPEIKPSWVDCLAGSWCQTKIPANLGGMLDAELVHESEMFPI